MKPKQFVFLLLCLTSSPPQIETQEVIDIVEDIAKVYLLTKDIWEFIARNSNGYIIPAIEDDQQKIINQLEIIDGKLDAIAERAESMESEIVTALAHKMENIVMIDLKIEDLTVQLTTIDSAYARMQRYLMNESNYEKKTLLDFANNVVSAASKSVINSMDDIQSFVIPTSAIPTNRGLFQLFADVMSESDDIMSNSKQSPQQVLFGLYHTLALAQLKSLTMVQFSYMLLKLNGKGRFLREAQDNQNKFIDINKKMIEVVRDAMQEVSRDLWISDPKVHIEGTTYEQLTNFMQGYIEIEHKLNSEHSCYGVCSDYSNEKTNNDSSTSISAQRGCGGRVSHCHTYDSDIRLLCLTNETARQYKYVQLVNGKIFGKYKGKCPTETIHLKNYYWKFIFVCSYCLCLCDNENNPISDRYFNLRSTIADVNNNKVVTGLRFVKQNQVIHLQIQQGELLPKLKINSASLEWKAVDDYKITDRYVYKEQDYHVIQYTSRSMNMTDLEADDGYILTGVRFSTFGAFLNLEIFMTKFDFQTGKLDTLSNSRWKNAFDIDNPTGTKVQITKPDIPILAPTPSVPMSQPHDYIQFGPTDIERDVAQTVVPFLDAQKVESAHPVPLSGAGIYYKGMKNFGGFVAPKIITYDMSKYLISTNSV